MNKTIHVLAVVTLAISTLGLPARPAAAADEDDVPLTIRGCVVPGEAKDSFLLTDVEVQGPAAPANAFYRFDTTSGLASQVGYRVEVKGRADLDDPDKGKMKMEVEHGKVETTISTEGKTVKTEENLWFGTEGSAKMKADIVSYKLHVDHVQRIAGATCANPAK